jgi:hypothetical protein
MTTPLDAEWSTLPLSNFYLPFVQSAVRFLSVGNTSNNNLLPGQQFRMIFDDPETARDVTLIRPDGRSQKLEVLLTGQQAEVRYAETDLLCILSSCIRRGRNPT